MFDGILYQYVSKSDLEEIELVVAKFGRQRVLEEYHSAPTARHNLAQKKYKQIIARYYWTGMGYSMEDYLTNCINCQ